MEEFPVEVRTALAVVQSYIKENRDDYSIVRTIHNCIDFAAMSDEALDRLTAFFEDNYQGPCEEEE